MDLKVLPGTCAESTLMARIGGNGPMNMVVGGERGNEASPM